MAIYIVGPVSEGGRDLARAIPNGRKLRELPANLRRGDLVVNWGVGGLRVPNGVTILNNAPIQNKLQDALELQRAGVPTITISRTNPGRPTTAQVVAAGPDPARQVWNDFMEEVDEARSLTFGRGAVIIQGLTDLENVSRRLREALNRPVPRQVAPAATPRNVEWIGRTNNHTGGHDLLTPTRNPDYWVRREQFEREVRIHSFDGLSIRAGVKRHREDFPNPHPWIRSYDGGWRIVYDGVSARQATRNLAAQAVRALGLDFGAVDIGIRADRSMCVLEVNRRPGLEGGSIDAYVRAISRRNGR